MSWGVLAIITLDMTVVGQLVPVIRELAVIAPRPIVQALTPRALADIWSTPYLRRAMQPMIARSQLFEGSDRERERERQENLKVTYNITLNVHRPPDTASAQRRRLFSKSFGP
jgi:hypothetical protein